MKNKKISTSHKTKIFDKPLNGITAQELTFEKLWESEESLRILMNSNPEAVFILDTSGNFIAANEKTAQRFGKPVKELIGTNVYSYLTPQLAESRKNKVEEVVRTNKALRFEDSRNNKYFDNYLHPIFDSSGKVIRIAVWVIEFTELKLAIDALKESEEKFRGLAENIEDIFWIRRGNEVIYVSPAYEKICGKSCESLYEDPNSFFQAIHPEDFDRVNQSFSSEKYQKDGLFNEEFRIVHPDGEVRWIWSKTFPIKKNNEVLRTVGIAEDITLLKKAEENIQSALIKEREMNELKSRFISTVSHEFRTPLGLILSSAELLQNYGSSWDDEKKNEQFNKIKKAVDNLTGLMNDILILGQEQASGIKLKPIDINLVQFINEIIEEIKSANTQIPRISFYSSVEIKINSDEKLLRQILINLLSNAVKFTPPQKNIFLNVRILSSSVLFELKDEGNGIPSSDIQNIFEPFIRANNVGETKGNGLGLSIVKHAVELLGGEITVKSKLGKGSCFAVTLPSILKA